MSVRSTSSATAPHTRLSDDEGAVPEAIDPAVLNRWIFNIDTVDKALHYVLEHRIKVDGGERLGKTIIFARNVPHARLIEKRYNHHYPRGAGKVARVIVSLDPKSQELTSRG